MPALGGWGHVARLSAWPDGVKLMGPETLALLQHPHMLVLGAPAQRGGCQCPWVLLGTRSLVTTSVLPSHLHGQHPSLLSIHCPPCKMWAFRGTVWYCSPPSRGSRLFSCLMRHVGVEIKACVQLECYFLFTSLFSFLSKSSASFLASSFFKADLLWWNQIARTCDPPVTWKMHQFSPGKSTHSTKPPSTSRACVAVSPTTFPGTFSCCSSWPATRVSWNTWLLCRIVRWNTGSDELPCFA